MDNVSEYFNKTTVTLKNVVWYFIIYTGIVIFWVQTRDHINDANLHTDAFTHDWMNRVERVEYDLQIITRRIDKRYDRQEEELKSIKNLLQSFIKASISRQAEKIE
jgi:hypothetical protein